MRKPAAARSLQLTGHSTPVGSSSSTSQEPGIQEANTPGLQFEESLNKLVEGRVRRSLQAVRAGKATPQQALQSAVQQLSAELSQQQFATLVEYFSAKHTQGQLSGAKQLLLQALCTVNQQQQPGRQAQQQDQQKQAKPCPDSLLSSKISAHATVSPAFQQQQHQQQSQQHHQRQHYQKSFPGLPAAGDTQDARRSRDQSTPPGPFQHLQQLTSAQQQHHHQQQQQQQQGAQQSPSTDSQQQDAQPSAAAAAVAAAGCGKCRAFKQGLSPLQV